MKVVIGGSGFIGSHLVKRFIGEGEDVKIIDATRPKFNSKANYYKLDITSISDLNKTISQNDEVYNFVSILGTKELMLNNKKAVKFNIVSAINVLDVCRKKLVRSLFYPSKPIVGLNTYTITKSAAEQFHLMYQKYFKMNPIIMRLFDVYGPGQSLYPVRKAIPFFIASALLDKPIKVYGDGKQTINPIYVEDVVEAIAKITKNYNNLSEIFDIGPKESITVNKLVGRIIKLTNSKSDVIYENMRLGEDSNNVKADNKKLSRLIKLKEFTDLDTGLRKTIDYYKNLDGERLTGAVNFHLKQN